MTGAALGGGIGAPLDLYGELPQLTRGDPEFVDLVPTARLLDRYAFFAYYMYPDTLVTIVRKKTMRGFLSVALECTGELSDWMPVGSEGEYEAAWLRLTLSFVPQAFAKGLCGFRRHEASSEGPFSVTIWGVGKEASYGYAGGIGSRSANEAPPPLVR